LARVAAERRARVSLTAKGVAGALAELERFTMPSLRDEAVAAAAAHDPDAAPGAACR
jgi:hypothetical protein